MISRVCMSKLLIIGDDGPNEVVWEHDLLGRCFSDFVRVSLQRNGSMLGSSTESPDNMRFKPTLCGARHLAVNLTPYDAALWSLTDHGPFDAALVGPDRSLMIEDVESSGAYAMASVIAKECSTILLSVDHCQSIVGRSASLAVRMLRRLFDEMRLPSRRMRAVGTPMVLWVKLYGSMQRADRFKYLDRIGWGGSQVPMTRTGAKTRTGLVEFKVLST